MSAYCALRRRAVLLVHTSCHDHQGIIVQRPLQRLGPQSYGARMQPQSAASRNVTNGSPAVIYMMGWKNR
jgi:hypothetical protein